MTKYRSAAQKEKRKVSTKAKRAKGSTHILAMKRRDNSRQSIKDKRDEARRTLAAAYILRTQTLARAGRVFLKAADLKTATGASAAELKVTYDFKRLLFLAYQTWCVRVGWMKWKRTRNARNELMDDVNGWFANHFERDRPIIDPALLLLGDLEIGYDGYLDAHFLWPKNCPKDLYPGEIIYSKLKFFYNVILYKIWLSQMIFY
jgi:hypothetical protein